MSSVDIRIYTPKDESLARYFPKIGDTWKGCDSWRSAILLPYIGLREWERCWVEYCTEKILTPHEGIVTRGDVQGWMPREKRVLIFTPYNCIALCHKHHNTESEPKPTEVFEWMCQVYGKQNVIDWVLSLPFRHYKPSIVKQIERIANEA